MKSLLPITISIIAACFAQADSGGPYEGVPDLKETETSPIFTIPSTKRPLSFFLDHIPQLKWNQDLNEPESYSWERIKGYHASIRILGHVRGQRILELRYTSEKRIAQGLDYADILVLLAKGQDTQPDSNLCQVIYYTSGGVTYNHTADYVPDGDKYGAVVVTRHYEGNGAHRESVGIRGNEEFEFVRFDPSNKEAEQAGADQPATRSESKLEGDYKPQPEAEGRSQ